MNCEHCNKEITSRQSTRFCGTACWYEFRKALSTIPCEYCKTPFKKSYATQKACSVECGNQSKMVDKGCTCKQCGKLFKRPHGKQRTFCSIRCHMLTRENATTGKAHPEGHKIKHSGGYIQVKKDANWVMEHRLVVQEVIGRKLHDREHVHHKDGNRSNNTPENLELWAMKGVSKKDPAGQRWSDLIESFPLVDGMAASDVRAMLLKHLINK